MAHLANLKGLDCLQTAGSKRLMPQFPSVFDEEAELSKH